MSQYVSSGVAARAVGVSLSTLNRWAAAGIIKPVLRTPGGQFRWDVDDLRRQLNFTAPEQQPDASTPVATATTPEPYPVVAAIVTSDKGVLVGRRNDRTPPWTFIAGTVAVGESPADAAIREVKEETGCLVAAGDLIGRRVHPATGRTMIYMSAQPTHGADVFVGDEHELAEVRWVGLDELDELMPDMFDPVREYLHRTLA